MPTGAFIQKLNARTIEREGVDVTLEGGIVKKAIVHEDDHELLRSIRDEGAGPEKQAIVLIFAGTAWGVVAENSKVTIGSGKMLRDFKVAPPLHPHWQQNVVTELAVVVSPW